MKKESKRLLYAGGIAGINCPERIRRVAFDSAT